MGRRYVYPAGTRALLDARAAELGVTLRVTETAEAIEVLCDDGPGVLAWERNQPVTALEVGGAPDGERSRLTRTVPAKELEALLSARTDTERRTAAAALSARVSEAARLADLPDTP